MTTDVATPAEVRKARRAVELSQMAVATRLGIARESYQYWEKHGRPLPRGLTALDALDAIRSLAED